MNATDAISGTAVALVLVGSAAFSAYRLAWWLVGTRPFALRFAAVLVGGLYLATLAFHILFAVGGFRPGPAVLAASAIALVASRIPMRHSLRRQLACDARIVRWLGRRWSAGPLAARCATAVAAGFIALEFARSLLLPPGSWDSIVYHAVRAARFVQGEFSFDPAPGSWSLYRNFFAGGEVLTAWSMLPFHNDMLTGLCDALLWLGIGASVWCLARQLGVKGHWATAAGCFALFVPTAQLEVPSGYVELPLTLCLVFAVAALIEFHARPRPGMLLAAALSTGLAFGIKPTAGISAGLVALLALLPLRHAEGRVGLAPLLPNLGLAAFAGLLPSLPWMLHAWADTGYPLSPVPLEFAGIRLGAADPHFEWSLAIRYPDAYTFAGEFRVLRDLFAAPWKGSEALGLVSLLPLLALPFAIRSAGARRSAVLIAVAIAALGFFSLFAPSMTLARHMAATSSSRYVLPGLCLAIPASFVWLRSGTRPSMAFGGLLCAGTLLNALCFGFLGWAAFEPLAMLKIAVGVGIMTGGAALLARKHPLVTVGFALCALPLALGQLRSLQLAHRYEAARESVQLHDHPRYWVAAAERLDTPDSAKSIAVTAGPNREYGYWFSYYLLGSRFQNRLSYVPVTRSGAIAPLTPGYRRAERAVPDSWRKRLIENSVTHIASFAPRSIELGWMEGDPEHFERVAGRGGWGVFRFLGRGPDLRGRGSSKLGDSAEPARRGRSGKVAGPLPVSVNAN